MQTSGTPGVQCSTQMPVAHDPQLAPREPHEGSVVLVVAVAVVVVVELVVAVVLVVVSQSTSL